LSLELPVVAVVFGSVTPPQGDILELRVHLGCTKEVSSFECLLQNFDKKYSPGGTYPINVGDNGTISIGRGTNCPLILTLRVEEIEPESTPVENYIRVGGRCWGEKLFRKVVTKTYENQKGEAIVKDLLDNFVGLSHVRDTTELVEDTDTTYTLLEYENTPVFDILKYIAESSDKAGVIGFDFRVEWDGKFAFFPKNSKTSPVSLSEKIEVSRYSKDIHRIRNKITVYGAAEKANPSDKDAWTETLDINNDTINDWTSGTGTGNVSLDNTKKIMGTCSIKHTTSTPDYYGCAILTFPSGMEVDCNKYPSLTFQIAEQSAFNGNVGVELEDSAGMKVRREIGISPNEKWHLQGLNVGKKHTDEWTHSVFNSQPFNWASVKKILWYVNFSGTGTGSFWIDNLFFNRKRWEATRENSGSQTNYGLRELVEVDEELHSDNECDLRAKALLDHLSDPAEFLTVRSTCLDYGTNRLLPGDKIHVTLPNENIDSDFRIISVEYRVIASEQTLEITLELGKEKPLLADYLYGLRATTVTVEKLMRTKAGLTGVAGSAGGGGGGGGGGMTQHGNEWHDPDMALATHNHNLADLAEKSHASLTNVTSDQHHPQAHTLASHSTKAHSELTNITADQHHSQNHNLDVTHPDVEIASPANNQVLTYESATSKWKNKDPTGGGTYRRSATKIVVASDSLDTTNADYVCDGTADEVEIEAAINALPASGGRVILMEGTFNISTPIDCVKSGVTIEGQGLGTKLFLINNANCHVLVIGNGATALSKVTIKNLVIDGNRVNQGVGTYHGIHLYGGASTYLDDFAIQDVHIYNARSYGVRAAYVNRLLLSGCLSQNCYVGAYQFYYAYDCVIFLCIAKDAGTYGWNFYGDRNVLSAVIGISAGTYGFLFSGNDNVASGGRFQGGGYAGSLNGSRNSVEGIVGNTGNQHGFYLNAAIDCVLSNCVFQGYTNDGIRLLNSDNNIVANNRCLGNGGYGINVSDAASDKTLVHGNICLGNTTGAINNLGTGTVLADNITA